MHERFKRPTLTGHEEMMSACPSMSQALPAVHLWAHNLRLVSRTNGWDNKTIIITTTIIIIVITIITIIVMLG